jgi:hypothetical protein
MRGELLPALPETWRHIWVTLADGKNAPEELFSELYREFAPMPRRPKEPTTPTTFGDNGVLRLQTDIAARDAYEVALARYADDRASYEEALDSRGAAEPLFQVLLNSQVTDEREAIAFLERSFSVIQSFEIEALEAHFTTLIRSFIDTFNLRYDLRPPFSFSTTLSGLFASLMIELRAVSSGDPHLKDLFDEFDDATGDTTRDPSAGRIKSCLLKQFNLAEALGQRYPGVRSSTLGTICGELNSWPHATLREALKKIYGFRSDFPGFSHGGNSQPGSRDLDMRDLIAISVLLLGFFPYLTHGLDLASIRGAA